MDWSKIEYFTEDEFRCKCGCGAALMDESFVQMLDDLRQRCGFPIRINSGYRCPAHNDSVSNSGRDGPHTTGKAADLGVWGHQAFTVFTQLTLGGWATGLGVNQKGARKNRFIHVDTLEDAPDRPRKWIWSY